MTSPAGRLLPVLSAWLVFCLPLPSPGQQATGLPSFGSFTTSPADVVNNANLNVHLQIPIFSRPGRGLSFSYALSFDNAVWSPVGSSGNTAWTPAPNWGWASLTQAQFGYLNFASSIQQCVNQFGQSVSETTWQNFSYTDHSGTVHSFPNVIHDTGNCTGDSNDSSGVATDGSGYTLVTYPATPSSGLVTILKDRSGTVITAPFSPGNGSGSLTDTLGNTISVTAGTVTSFYDTLSSTTPALTISGSGSAASPAVFSYTNPSGGQSSYKLNYSTDHVQTNFGCAGVQDYDSASHSPASRTMWRSPTCFTFRRATTSPARAAS